MSWICPNCSNSNSDSVDTCMVCGMDRPHAVSVGVSPKFKICYSDMDAFIESFKVDFHSEKSKTEKPGKETKTDVKKVKDRSTKTVAVKPEHPKTPLFRSAFAKPWPEHKIKFDADVIKSRGFVKSEQQTVGGINGYCFYKEDGTSQFIRVEMLLVLKMAHKV